MPIYAYACVRCDHELDALQKISDAPLVDCPACGEPQLRKLLSAPRFRLKGTGWYETDFKTDNKRNLAGDEPPKSGDAKGGKQGDKQDGKKDGKQDSGARAEKKTESRTSSASA